MIATPENPLSNNLVARLGIQPTSGAIALLPEAAA
jgi:hypothetical protein